MNIVKIVHIHNLDMIGHAAGKDATHLFIDEDTAHRVHKQLDRGILLEYFFLRLKAGGVYTIDRDEP